ncbi:MAG TPA: branched-chain amino acid ABC transporter permease [Xanthobacteraceae bacterium]|jgi:branched-chain amino acid transport system permease protein
MVADSTEIPVVSRSIPPRISAARIWVPILVLALFIPWLTNEYTQYVVNLMLVYILVTVGFNIAIGHLGQLAFCNVAFFGIGAYATAIPMAQAGLPFWLALLPCAVAGALAGVLASFPALRGIRALYLAIMTLAFGELMRWLYIHAEAVTMGSTGLPVPAASFFGLPLASAASKFYAFFALTVLIVLGASNLLRSRVGRAIIAINNDELVAASLGIHTARYIVLAFALSGTIVALAGGMFAVLIGRVVPESFNLIELIQHFAMVMVGGLGSLGGSILGAVILTAAPEAFRSLPGFEEVFLGGLLVCILLFLPRGLISLLARLLPGLEERYYLE